MISTFKNRSEAGKLLAKILYKYSNNPDVLVLALPRGGVPVAFQVAKELHVKLDIFIVGKLGVPGHEELAMGALAWGDVTVLNQEIISTLSISENSILNVKEKESQELKRRNLEYRDQKPFPVIENKTIILIDDGIATGATMRAAIAALKQLNPVKIIVAIPVAPIDACEEIRSTVNDLLCLETPEPFYAVGTWYDDFSQTTDQEVRELLAEAENLN